MTKPQQLLLDLPHRAAFGKEDFLVTEANAAAVRLIDEWPHWPSYGAILVGPEGCGKTHLAQVWRRVSSANVLSADEAEFEVLEGLLAEQAICLEDLSASPVDEKTLFHVLNFARQQSASILLTSREHPQNWNINLPDLSSRLNALPVVGILPPDDALLRGVLVKHFSDRQITVDENLISYIVTRMPRSLAAAKAWVAEIDRSALIAKAEITRAFVAKLMAENTLFTTS